MAINVDPFGSGPEIRPPAKSLSRLVWMDVLRGAGKCWGCWKTHVHQTPCWMPGSTQVNGSTSWTYYNGLIAPRFSSGSRVMRRGIVDQAGWVQEGQARRHLAKRVKAPGPWIALLGYLLHLPLAALAARVTSGPKKLAHPLEDGRPAVSGGELFFPFDCRAFSSGGDFDVCSAGLRSSRGGFWRPAAAHWHTGFAVLDPWLNRSSGSMFPLFPWFRFLRGLAHWASRMEPRALIYLPLWCDSDLSRRPRSWPYPFFLGASRVSSSSALGYLTGIVWAVYWISSKTAARLVCNWRAENPCWSTWHTW